MDQVKTISSYRKRHKRWQDRIPLQTRHLSQLVDTQLIPYFETFGFTQVGKQYLSADRNDLVEAKDICLEKIIDNKIQNIYISFDKYDSPKFQIYFNLHQLVPDIEFISSESLVRKSNQYVCFWGKPWWLPRIFWTDAMSKYLIKKLLLIIKQILDFLKTGVRGENIGNKKILFKK
ncbi:hypothetical protein MMP65_04770 [Acinetobacter sp. ANC 3926]|nr:hypothetical protein [Acinetobacter genomosp. 15BJ]MCH7290779.1 hypothetical protein [Acinetobacter genomosp. 15BJ]